MSAGGASGNSSEIHPQKVKEIDLVHLSTTLHIILHYIHSFFSFFAQVMRKADVDEVCCHFPELSTALQEVANLRSRQFF